MKSIALLTYVNMLLSDINIAKWIFPAIFIVLMELNLIELSSQQGVSVLGACCSLGIFGCLAWSDS